MDDEPENFEALVTRHFAFLEEEKGMVRGSVHRYGGGDPRDAGLIVRYKRDDMRVHVAWAAIELALVVSIRFELPTLARGDRYVYFEPYLECRTGGKTKPIVPYITQQKGARKVYAVMNKRSTVFNDGLAVVVEALAKKLRLHFSDLEATTADDVRAYHEWTE